MTCMATAVILVILSFAGLCRVTVGDGMNCIEYVIESKVQEIKVTGSVHLEKKSTRSWVGWAVGAQDTCVWHATFTLAASLRICFRYRSARSGQVQILAQILNLAVLAFSLDAPVRIPAFSLGNVALFRV